MRRTSEAFHSMDDALVGELHGPGPTLDYVPLRISRGFQRAIGTMMILTDFGAPRHYTISYGQFYERLESDVGFKDWFNDISEDISFLANSSLWEGEPPFPVNRWTRVLLLQQLLVELIDLLDPDCIRITVNDRRKRLMPVEYAPLPNLKQYQKNLMDIAALGSTLQSNTSERLVGLKDLLGRNGTENS